METPETAVAKGAFRYNKVMKQYALIFGEVADTNVVVL